MPVKLKSVRINNQTSASYALTASYALNGGGGGGGGTNITSGSTYNITSSYATTASYALNGSPTPTSNNTYLAYQDGVLKWIPIVSAVVVMSSAPATFFDTSETNINLDKSSLSININNTTNNANFSIVDSDSATTIGINAPIISNDFVISSLSNPPSSVFNTGEYDINLDKSSITIAAIPLVGSTSSWTTSSYTYYRWRITEAKITPPNANCIQASEFIFQVTGSDASMAGVTVTNPNGNNPVGEGPSNLVDGTTAAKALDLNFVTNGFTDFVFQFTTAKAFDGYRWATANDEEGRDPKSWTIAGSNNGTTWATLHTVSGFTATATRQAYQTAQAFY